MIWGYHHFRKPPYKRYMLPIGWLYNLPTTLYVRKNLSKKSWIQSTGTFWKSTFAVLNASSAKDFALDVLNGTEAWCFLEVMCLFSLVYGWSTSYHVCFYHLSPWQFCDLLRVRDPWPEIKFNVPVRLRFLSHLFSGNLPWTCWQKWFFAQLIPSCSHFSRRKASRRSGNTQPIPMAPSAGVHCRKLGRVATRECTWLSTSLRGGFVYDTVLHSIPSPGPPKKRWNLLVFF